MGMDSALWTNVWWLVGMAVVLTINVVALIVIPRRRKPTAAMAWLLLILLVPLFGILFYLLIGNFRLPERRRGECARIASFAPAPDAAGEPASWPRTFQRVVEQNETLSGLPAMAGNRMTLIEDYQGTIDEMSAEIDRAQRYVHVEFLSLIHI